MKTTHTPGPWRLLGTRGNEQRTIVADKGFPVLSSLGLEQSDYISEAQADANARLIAAAPEMHNELLGTATACEQFATNPDVPKPVRDAMWQTAKQSRALLARIDGTIRR